MTNDEGPSTPNAAEQMIRATYTAPTLIGEGSGSPLLDQARRLVDEDFPTGRERAAEKPKPADR